ncbi:MAG: hypothetical protein IJL91_09365 [Bacteroidales bacterium]|nr:hypothetical protein [Bacteroidales bacterium]
MKQIRISVEKLKIGDNEEWTGLERETHYSKDGLLLYEYRYGHEQERETVYKYNENGQLVSKTIETETGSVMEVSYSYTEDGKISEIRRVIDGGDAVQVERNIWSDDGSECKVIYDEKLSDGTLSSWSYDEKYKGDLLVKSVRHSPDGKVMEIETYSHYPDGTLMEEVLTIISEADGTPVEETVTRSYNRNGELVRVSHPGDEVFEFTYELDEEGNWTGMKIWDHAGTLHEEFVREIAYWDDDEE